MSGTGAQTNTPYAGLTGAGIVLVKQAFLVGSVTANPNSNLAGNSGTPSSPPDLVYDYVHQQLWICTSTGNATTAIWSPFTLGGVGQFSQLAVTGGFTAGSSNVNGTLTATELVANDAITGKSLSISNGAVVTGPAQVGGATKLLGGLTVQGGPSLIGARLDGSLVPAGNVGEFLDNISNSIAQTNLAITNLTSLNFTAGSWLVWGTVAISAASVSVGALAGYISASNAGGAIDVSGQAIINGPTLLTNTTITIGPVLFLAPAPAMLFLNSQCNFSSGSVTCFGRLQALRYA